LKDTRRSIKWLGGAVRFVFALLILAGIARSSFAQEVTIPDLGLNAAIRAALQIPTGPLTQQDLLNLTFLDANGRSISNLTGLESARNLVSLELLNNRISNFSLPSSFTNLTFLDVSANPLTNCSFPSGLTHLETIFLESTSLTNLTLPAGLTALNELDAVGNRLASLALPGDVTNLVTLNLAFNQLTNIFLPTNLTQLASLDLTFNNLKSLNLPVGLTNLHSFHAGDNQLAFLSFPADMTNLTFVDLGDNQLAGLSIPSPLPHANFLRLVTNKLTNLILPPGMTNLAAIFLAGNQLTNLVLSPDLTHLVQLDVRGNSLTNLTLLPDMTQLITLGLDGNPLKTFVVSEPMSAAPNLAGQVATLRNQGVAVFTYPLTVQLKVSQQQNSSAFRFAITGPPGVYTIQSSTNLANWSALSFTANLLGSVTFTDATSQLSPQKYYRALQTPRTDMVFVSPNTFTMGSPTNDLDSSSNERPQTTVTLTRGYWVGKYEVTQREYLAVVSNNPSEFPDDLSRAVSSVAWMDATNYCWQLTQRDLAAGRIPAGSHYRLPTEAEWECAARAGTTTGFSYGNDPAYAVTTNYAWFIDLGHPDLTVHAVGQKLPNPWGLYDVHGNVWEWCQDDYAALRGGVQIDPTGPASTLLRDKVMRGGAYDYPNSSCRSASRLFRFPLWPDTDVGFRVVLVTGP
jgi:formylglycine-generating enzyme required for sulfatase activity